MRLCHEHSAAGAGDRVFVKGTGEKVTIDHWSPPHPGIIGQVYVRTEAGQLRGYQAHELNLRWKP
jgi:hypothetical protein